MSSLIFQYFSTFFGKTREGEKLITNVDNILFIQAVSAILKRNKLNKVKPRTYRELADMAGVKYSTLKDFMYDGRGGENVNKKIAAVLKIER